jgi:hypothetical protein
MNSAVKPLAMLLVASLLLLWPVAATANRGSAASNHSLRCVPFVHAACYVIVPGRSIGPVALGDSKAKVDSALGPGKPFSGGAYAYVPPGCLAVVYLHGHVLYMELVPIQPCAVRETFYHTQTRPQVGVGDDFNVFVRAFPHRSCESQVATNPGNPEEDLVLCNVSGPHGSDTAFSFAGPVGRVPALDEIQVLSHIVGKLHFCGWDSQHYHPLECYR